MKKLLLSGLIALISTFALGQTTTKIGTSTNYVEVRHLLQIDGLSNSAGNDSALIIDGTTHKVKQKLLSGGGYVLPTASAGTLGGVKVGSGLTISSGILSAPANTLTFTGDATGTGTTSVALTVAGASITNSKLADMAQNTIKGRISSGTGSPEDLTSTQTKTILLLDQVENYSSANLPISTATQTALNLKANLASPALTGIPTAPTATPGTNTSQIATTAFVIANSGGGSGYVLPIASFSTLGGIKIGAGLAIDGAGLVSTTGSGVSSVFGRTGAISAQTGDYLFNQIGSRPTTIVGYGITDAFTQSLADARYSLLGHTHTFSSLTSKPSTLVGYGISDPIVVTSGSYADPSWITTLNWSKVTGRATTIFGYGITDAVSLAGVQTLTNKTITAPLGIVKADVGLGSVDNTSDVTKNAASVTLTNKTISGVSNTLSNIAESSIINLVSDLTLKSPLASPTFTGNVTLPSTPGTNAVLLTDNTPLFTFGAGSANTGDTLSFTTSTVYGSVFVSGSDNFVITSMNIALQGSSPNITVDVLFGASLNSGGTHLVNAGTAATNTAGGTNISVFNNATIPAGNHVWVKTPTVVAGSKPTYLQVTLIGHKVRN